MYNKYDRFSDKMLEKLYEMKWNRICDRYYDNDLVEYLDAELDMIAEVMDRREKHPTWKFVGAAD